VSVPKLLLDENGKLHPDLSNGLTYKEWLARLEDIFKTKNAKNISVLIEEMCLALCPTTANHSANLYINMYVEYLSSAKPHDALELNLLTCSFIAQHLAMLSLKDSYTAQYTAVQDKDHDRAVKYFRVCGQLSDALRRYRNKGTQYMFVNYVNANQAIVGSPVIGG